MKAILKKANGGKPELVAIKNELQELQEYVCGFIEVVPIADNVVLIVNEEGKLRDLPINFWIGRGSQVCDCIRGDALICATDGEEFCDLTEEQITLYSDIFKGSVIFLV